MKSGYLYVLVHPSNPNLIKIGQTILKPEKRLAQHNCNFEEYAGKIVKETGQKWELKTYIEVADPAYAEAVFWEILCPGPFKQPQGIEVMEIMDFERVQMALDTARTAGIRPPPKPFPDWVYAYTAWMKKRLEGRDITLIGYVKSMVSGNATFRCKNGHEWRTRCAHVADGEGCPKCGIGKRTTEEVWQAAKLGYIYLMVHPNKLGMVKFALTQDQSYEKYGQEGWQEHRFRFVEDSDLAETLIWQLLGQPKPDDNEIKIDLKVAEQAFRSLIYEMYRHIALEAKKNDQRV